MNLVTTFERELAFRFRHLAGEEDIIVVTPRSFISVLYWKMRKKTVA